MSKTDLQDRHGVPPESLAPYEPPRIDVLGSLPELTAGVGGTTPEPGGTSAD